MTDGLKDAHREAIIATLAANDRVERAVLFGSRATGTNTVSSDVDIALLGQRLTLTDQARLVAALDEIPMAQSVDLLLYDSLQDRTLREHIRRQGVEWYSRSRDSWSAVSGRHSAEEWPTVRLGDAVDLLTGFPFKSDGYVSDPAAPRLLRGDNIAQGRLRWDRAKRWPAETAPPMAKFRLHEGDVVLAMDRPWIEAGLKFASVQREDLPALLVQRVARFRGGEGLDTRFLKYVIGCRDFSDYVLSVQTGTAVPHISARQIEDYEFDLPPLAEQTAVAHILGTLDDKIELNRRMNATLEAMARALFRSWFVDFEPVRAKMEGRDTGLPKEIADLFPDRMVDSELGKVPEEWAVGVLDDAVELLNGGTPRTSVERFWNGGIPWYTAKDAPAPHDVFAVETERTITQAGVDNSATVVLPSGTTIISARGSVGRLACLGRPMAMNQTCYGIRGAGGYGDFFTYWLVRGTVEELRSRTHGTIFDTITRQTFALVNSALPPLSIVGAFESVVLPIMERILSNLNQSVAIAALRDTLLPRLVSGELRVTGLEAPSRADDRPASVGTHEA